MGIGKTCVQGRRRVLQEVVVVPRMNFLEVIPKNCNERKRKDKCDLNDSISCSWKP